MLKKIENLVVHATTEDLARSGAGLFVDRARGCVEKRGIFTVVLSGGSTPGEMFNLLASVEFRDRVPWNNVHIFWGDERCVSPISPESNYRLAFDKLISKVGIPEENVHRMKGEGEPPKAALEYEKELKDFFLSRGLPFAKEDPEVPVLDLVFLGLGPDGHTLSLFPGSSAVSDERRLVVENYVDILAAYRLTMTPRLVNYARTVVFLVSGENKAEILKAVVEGMGSYPAGLIRPVDGKLLWLVGGAAARLL